MVHCAHCGETRRTVSIWQQLVNPRRLVCCVLREREGF